MPPRLRRIAERHLKDPQRIAIEREKTATGKLPRVRQVAYVVRRPHKAAALAARPGHGESRRPRSCSVARGSKWIRSSKR